KTGRCIAPRDEAFSSRATSNTVSCCFFPSNHIHVAVCAGLGVQPEEAPRTVMVIHGPPLFNRTTSPVWNCAMYRSPDVEGCVLCVRARLHACPDVQCSCLLPAAPAG